jgi:hypothetical protein
MLDVDAAYRNSPLFQQLEAIATSGWTLPDSRARRHHYNPRLIVRRFVGRAKDGSQQLYRLDVKRGTPKRTSVDNAGSELRYYRFSDDEGRPHNRVESFFSIVEAHAAEALTRLLAVPHALSGPDRATLSFFFALLDGRTPGGTARTAAFSDTSMRLLLATECADPQAFAARYRDTISEGSDEEIEATRRRMVAGLRTGDVAFPDPKANALKLGLQSAGSSCKDIFLMRWSLLRARDGEFVTSDRALAMHDPSPEYPWSAQAWRSSPDVETTIPLSSNACLLVTPGPPFTDERGIARETVERINLRTYGWAQRYLYGSSQQTVVEMHTAAKKRPRDVVRPITPKQVLLFEADPSDDALSREHGRRRWPGRLAVEGVEHDYVVLDSPGDPIETVEQAARVAQVVKDRSGAYASPDRPRIEPVDSCAID